MSKKRNALFELKQKAYNDLAQFRDLHSGEQVLSPMFSGINSFIAKEAYQNGENLYIGMKGKDSPNEVILAIIYPLLIQALKDSPHNYTPPLQYLLFNSVFVKNRTSYIYEKYQGKDSLKSWVKGGYRYHHLKDLSEITEHYLVANEESYSDRKCHKNLDKYDKFCIEELQLYRSPCFFKRKIMVVCNKKGLIEQIQKSGMWHQIPLGNLIASRYWTEATNIPIDPLVIMASNYEEAREYMISKKDEYEFEYLLITGDTKASKAKTLVVNDHANGLFKQFCMIGNQMSSSRHIKLWHWNKAEELNLMGKHQIEILYNVIPGCEALVQSTNALYSYFQDLYEEYYLSIISNDARFALRNMLNDRLKTKISEDTFFEYEREKMQKTLLADNFELEDAIDIVDSVIEKLKNIKERLDECQDIWSVLHDKWHYYDAIVVPNSDIEEWENKAIEKGFSDLRLIAFSEFKKLIKADSADRTYLMPYLPYARQLHWLFDQFTDNKIKLDLLLYPPETSIFKSYKRAYDSIERNSTGKKHTDFFSDSSFSYTDYEEELDLIGRFEEAHLESYFDDGATQTSNTEHSGFVIEVMDQDQQMIPKDCPQRVLKQTEEGIISAYVNDLEEGDKILLYNNVGQDALRRVLMRESDRYSKVGEFSRLWKQKLLAYLSKKSDFLLALEGEDEKQIDVGLLREFALKLGVKAEYIQNNWLSQKSKLLFAQKSKMEALLKALQNNGYLSIDEASEIRSSRAFYTGISISIGLNLSSELQSIMLQNPDNLEEFIEQNVRDNRIQFPLLNKIDASVIQVFLKHNFSEYTFIKIVDREVYGNE